MDIEDVLNELFLKKTQQRSYWDFFGDDSGSHDRTATWAGFTARSASPASRIPTRSSSPSNSKENLAVVEDVLKQLDTPSEAGESTLRVGLKFAKANDRGQQHEYFICQERFAAAAAR